MARATLAVSVAALVASALTLYAVVFIGYKGEEARDSLKSSLLGRLMGPFIG